jgi:hypothetical protein
LDNERILSSNVLSVPGDHGTSLGLSKSLSCVDLFTLDEEQLSTDRRELLDKRDPIIEERTTKETVPICALRSQVLDSTNSVGLHSTLLPIDPEKRLLLEYIGSEDCMNPQLFYKLSEKLVIAGDLEEALKMLDEHVLNAFPSANKTLRSFERL